MSVAAVASAALRPHDWPMGVWVLLLTGLAYAVGALVHRPSFPKSAPKLFKSHPVVGSPRFFSNRGNFMTEGRRLAKSGNWSFYFGKMRIVGLSGVEGRRLFFESRELDFTKGYGALLNATPQINLSSGERSSDDSFDVKFNRNLVRLLRKDVLSERLHILVSDARGTMDDLAARIGPSSEFGTSDPFEDMYRLVFQLTVRMVGCDEVAEDPVLLLRMLRIFEGIDSAATATKIMFPWMPTVGQMRRVISGGRMYRILEGIIRERKARGVPGNDALQFLMDNGDSTIEMVAFLVGALFAGLINTGIDAAYLLCFIAGDAHWYGEFQREVDGVISRRRRSAEQTADEILAGMTMDEWEAEFPLIDLGLKEVIRHTLTGCGFRYNNSGRDLPIGKTGEVVPREAYVVYQFDSTHMDPEFFTDPSRWDPGRYLPGREEDKKDPHAFIGWGTGRHPCLGMRFAKLEMAVTTAMFLARFDFYLADANGNKMDKVPESSIDRNKHSAAKPREKMFLKFKPRT
ncbi:cytochrome P450 6A1 [Colletotrichum navitas]|uniref:Cytochrome P450 6A1 n=1 Tax=Colletotrichum navitas TaxID=681940 RepID=A0AAD8V121_9PEZI|nr:cytochrome P450 6A1 [Colletotrichum navitas]KAK1573915.1 cytochrome P450 6A1 [Colletotrichum navitas]